MCNVWNMWNLREVRVREDITQFTCTPQFSRNRILFYLRGALLKSVN